MLATAVHAGKRFAAGIVGAIAAAADRGMQPGDRWGGEAIACPMGGVMDGSAILRTPLSPDQRAICDMLKETLAQALEGNFHAIGIVVCMKSGYSHAMAGSDAGNLNLGCDSLKKSILEAVESSPKTKQVTRLLRGRM